jgi:GNAT superfamily N-acetyltransferase
VRSLPVTARLARPSDAETMTRSLHLGFATNRSFGPHAWAPPPFPNEIELARERLRSRHTWALMAEIAGEPAGHVAMFPDAARDDTVYLWQLFVRPAWWGTGLAHALHEAFAEEARARGYRQGSLNTPAPHARARRFYERHGWRPAGPPDDQWRFGIPTIAYRCHLERHQALS